MEKVKQDIKEQWQIEHVLKAMAEADEGKVLTDQEFRKIIENLEL